VSEAPEAQALWNTFLQDASLRIEQAQHLAAILGDADKNRLADNAQALAAELSAVGMGSALLGIGDMAELAAAAEQVAALISARPGLGAPAAPVLQGALGALAEAVRELGRFDSSGSHVDSAPLSEARAAVAALLPRTDAFADAPPTRGRDAEDSGARHETIAPASVSGDADDTVWTPLVDDDMIDPFVDECNERLEGLAQKLVSLEESATPDLVNDVFRDLHTVKGSSAFVGLKRMNRVAHAAEDLVGQVRDGSRRVDRALVDTLLMALDHLRRILQRAIRREPIDVDVGPLLQRLRMPLAAGAPEMDQPETPSAHTPGPAPTAAPSGTTSAGGGVAVAKQTLRVDFDKLDLLLNLVGELVLGKSALHGGLEGLSSLMQELEHQRRSARRVGVALTHRRVLDPHRDPLRGLSDELARVTRACADLHQDLTGSAGRIDRVAADLRDQVMKLRMVPISRIFGKYPRTIRELSQKLDKRVRLQVEGAETELDKLLVEQLDDPLMHLARNAIDHGVEPAAVRLAAGKPEEGTLTLRARHHGNQIHIEVEDDGAGIVPSKLKQKALEKGILSAAEAAALDDQAATQLIFRAGFSTAARISEVSGRGVGMDVVHDAIARLKGTIDIDTAPGRGTRFILRLPLTLAILQVLLARAGAETFAIPLDSVVGTLRVNPAEIHSIYDREVLKVRDAQVPLIALDDALELEPDPEGRDGDAGVVLVHVRGETFGLVVDRLLGKRETVIKPLGDLLQQVPCVAGATLIGDRCALILDVPAIVARVVHRQALGGGTPARRSGAEGAGGASGEGGPRVNARQRILLVDDSVTIRTALRRTLEQHGYAVTEAQDGVDALRIINASADRFDLVSTDVMMPNMDGYELTRALREHPRYRDVPVVMVTSRGEKIDRIRGFDAGVDDYILKPMDRGEILRAVGRHLGERAPHAAGQGDREET
jgi:chemotaxis protein histidine kinase CheA/ActR/RegA family two-component response regulator